MTSIVVARATATVVIQREEIAVWLTL